MKARALGLIGAAFLAWPACAAVVLDQYYLELPWNASVPGSDASTRRVQTFTIGTPGILMYVDCVCSSPFVRMDLLSTTLGAPTPSSTVLATVPDYATGFIVEGDIPWTRFDVSGAALEVATGDVFGIELFGTTSSFAWSGHAPGGYAGGSLYYSASWLDGAFIDAGGVFDAYFRTYVDEAVAAPEPGTLALLGLGLAGLGLIWRRKAS